jgi:hypothetical protein
MIKHTLGGKTMKRILYVVAAALLIAPATFAQEVLDHVEFGAFAHYFRLTPMDTNFAGVGGRFGVNVTNHVQVEAEMSYDFNQVFTETYSNASGTVSTFRSNIRVLHGLFGPKVQTRGPVRLFATVKGGFIHFRFDAVPSIVSGFTSSVEDLRDNNVDGVLYPGGGIEGFFGPIGLRLDVGDEIYFNNGAHNNLAVGLGPTIRF